MKLRLDFLSFQIAGPSTSTVSTHLIRDGVVVSGSVGSGDQVGPASQCLNDAFSITGVDRGGSDVLCGVNTGQHCKYSRAPL